MTMTNTIAARGRFWDDTQTPARTQPKRMPRAGSPALLRLSSDLVRRVARPLVPGALALGAMFLACTAQDAVNGQLLAASTIALLALTLRAAESSSSLPAPDTRPTETHTPEANAMKNQSSTTSSHVLIDGLFEGRDAQDILLALLDAKIKYHKRRCFSSMERTGSSDAASEQRVIELTATQSRVRKLLSDMLAEDQQVRIHSVLELSPVARVTLQEDPSASAGLAG